MNDQIRFSPIGIIHTPFTDISGVPIQTKFGKKIKGTIELQADMVEGLKDIEGFSHLILLYHFHKTTSFSLLVNPFMDDKVHGIFATRAPVRPKAIGFSIVRLLKVKNNILYFSGVDMVDNTPLIDIKPYYPGFDNRKAKGKGWLKDKPIKNKSISDNRFK